MKLAPVAYFILSAMVLLPGVCFSQQPAEESHNLLRQPTFEKQTWDVQFFGNQGRVSTDHTEMHDGYPSLRIQQATPPGVAFLNQKISCKPATRYRFSGWIKATKMVLPNGQKSQKGQPAGAALAVFPGLGNSGWVSDTGDWVYASVDFKTKEGQSEVQLGPRIGFNEWRPHGTAWFADLSLIELKEPEAPKP
jgi:hypothetical protein